MKFYLMQKPSVQEKIDFVLKLIKTVDKIPYKYFKSIEGVKGLLEIRIEYEGDAFRIFCCFDKGNVIILFNGFTKKSKRTPKKEIDLAMKLKNEYSRKAK
jgi:phage-related protein